MTSLDRETRAAIAAVTRLLRDRDPTTDNEVLALTVVQALIGRGWRPTEAKPPPAWKRPAGTGSQPPAGVLAKLRADLAARTARTDAEASDG